MCHIDPSGCSNHILQCCRDDWHKSNNFSVFVFEVCLPNVQLPNLYNLLNMQNTNIEKVWYYQQSVCLQLQILSILLAGEEIWQERQVLHLADGWAILLCRNEKHEIGLTTWQLPADWSKGISYNLLNQSERIYEKRKDWEKAEPFSCER